MRALQQLASADLLHPFYREMGLQGGPREMLIILACLAGVLLGLTFNVAVLLSVTVAGALAFAFQSQGQGLGAVTVIAVAAVSLHGGYMIGLTGRDMFAQLLARLNIAQSKRV
jgi:hypothetical protein